MAANLKINAEKSFFTRSELEYLGFWITQNGIRPLMKKVEAIQNLTAPKACKEICQFIGIVNYYQDMWPHGTEVLALLS